MKRLLINLKEADIRNILAVIVVLACFAIQTFICFKEIPNANHDVVISTITLTLGCQTLVLGYYFGSSKGAGKKEVNGDSEKPIT